MKRIASSLISCFCLINLLPAAASADVASVPPPIIAKPALVVTAFGGTSQLDFAEIFNQTSAPISVDGLTLEVTSADSSGVCNDQVFELGSGWLLAQNYLNIVPAAGNASASCEPQTSHLASLVLASGSSEIIQKISIPASATGNIWVHQQRANKSAAREISGSFLTDYKPAKTPIDCSGIVQNGQNTLCNDGLYAPPSDVSGLAVVEVLPHSRDCSPLDNASNDCADYVKIYNSAASAVDLSSYRLRAGYKGQATSVTNTFSLSGTLAPGSYSAIAFRDDGASISLTDSGGFVWLEDAAGVKIYEPVVEYPSASSTSKIGASWAFDGVGWQWTTTPQPFGQNIITQPAVASASTSSSVTSLKPCADDQYRNPDTNRCKLTASTVTSLTPCADNQERNPATNRCKAIGSTAGQLTPCQPGWTRNPDTNRCRKGAGNILGSSIKDVKEPGSATGYTGWIVALAVTAAALGYGAYEWRQEIANSFLRLKSRLAR